MKKLFILALPIVFVLTACGIKRDNPLDPNYSSDIVVPVQVTGLQDQVVLGTTPYVILSWNSNAPFNTDGYFVYRSLGYNSAYAVVDTVWHVDNEPRQSFTHSAANDHTVAPGDYYYRVSAFKDFPAGRLEGRQSTPKFVRISSQ
jgi:hypothetical protein